MAIHISEHIKRLRHSRELTQEKLADILGVSSQSVSKWECGDNFPDITLLPAIANFFEVTVDDLLGMNEIRDAKRVEETKAKTLDLQFNQSFKHEDIIALWKELAQELPGNWEAQMHYAINLETYSDRSTTESASAAISAVIPIYERILENNTDENIRNQTYARLVNIYSGRGEFEKAREYAGLLPPAGISREWITQNIVLGEISNYVHDKGLNTRELMKTADPDDVKEILKPYETALEVFAGFTQMVLSNLRTCRKIYGLITDIEYIKMLELDKAAFALTFIDKPERYNEAVIGYHLNVIYACIEIGDLDGAFENLDKYVDLVVQKPWSETVQVRQGGVDEDGKPIQKHYEQSLRQMQTMMVEHIPEQINMFTKM
ncbi:MAG: helix-turn-helix transcriptional regulator, partial [Oscillospiraceae bacterium]|nr:helix-turn-helix transcriptional regulator [Oscillospiraceae bacterium]